MKPARFAYQAPASLEEALALLANADDARVLAGGQSLIPMMNFRIVAPAMLIDLGRIAALSYIREGGGVIRIGAMTRQRQLEFSPLVATKLPLLLKALSFVGHLPTRSRGTIGGSISHADPAAEIPMVLQALGGEVVARRAGGERVIAAADLFSAALTTTLAPDEILTEVRLPAMLPGTGVAVEEFARRHGDFAIGAIAATVRRQASGGVAVRLAAAGLTATSLRLRSAEAALEAAGLSAAAIEATAQQIGRDLVEPLSDQNGSADYRRHIAGVLARRALTEAAARAA